MSTYRRPRCVYRIPFIFVLTLSIALFATSITDAGGDAPAEFLRGDCDGNGVVSAVVDVLFLLEFGLTNGEEPTCLDACDVNDDGRVHSLLDAIHLITWGWEDGPEPPAPGPDNCGTDVTTDNVSCESPPECI